jgi:putative transposase
MPDSIFKPGLHNPPHLFVANAFYMLTGSIYQSENLIQSAKRKEEWRDTFYASAKIYKWQVSAWVVLNNHYHAIVKSPNNPTTLSKFAGSYHKFTARKWNDEDGRNSRKVWWNYWDTCIRSERDYINRLKYVFWNPVKHGLVERPEDYPFSNYKEFMENQIGIDFTEANEITDAREF